MNDLEVAKVITLDKWTQIQTTLAKLIEDIQSSETCGFCQEYECFKCEGKAMCNKVQRFIQLPLDSALEFLELNLLPYLKPEGEE